MLSANHITLPSNVKEAFSQFDTFLDRVCDVYNINNSYYSTLKVALSEAVKNAIVHGNKENKYKYVQVDLDSSHNGLTFSILDEGNGFDYENTLLNADQTATGLFLIRSLSDALCWEQKGRCIKITFYISHINYDHAVLRQEILKNYFKNIQLQYTEKKVQPCEDKNFRI